MAMTAELVHIRISGPPTAVKAVADCVRQRLNVAEESPDYRNRRDPGVRRYLAVLVENEERRER